MIGIGKAFTGLFIASVALLTALAIHGIGNHSRFVQPGYGARGTFNTEHLTVDETATMGTSAAAGLSVLELTSKTAGTSPLNFSGGATNIWDASVATAHNTDPATITIFAHTPTTTPSVDSSLAVEIIPGDHGAGGVYLRPNGPSFFDPDGYAGHGKILALGFTTPDYELDVRDNHNARTQADCVNDGTDLSCRVINASGVATFATGAGANVSYEGVNGSANATRTSGTALLLNRGLRGDAQGGDSNYALWTDHGDVYLNAVNGTATAHGALTCQAGLTTTTMHATGQITGDTSASITGNIQSTTGSVTAAGTINNEAGTNKMSWFVGGSGQNDIYFFGSDPNQNLNIDSSGTGAVNINTNQDGITNSGTGGLVVSPGNNSSLLGTVLPGTGQIEDRGTHPTPSGCGGSPVVLGGAYSGLVLTDVGATTCVLTFAASLHGNESCIVTDETAGAVPVYSHTPSALSITAIAAHAYDFDCRGH